MSHWWRIAPWSTRLKKYKKNPTPEHSACKRCALIIALHYPNCANFRMCKLSLAIAAVAYATPYGPVLSLCIGVIPIRSYTPLAFQKAGHSPGRWGVSANTAGDQGPQRPSKDMPSGLVRTWMWYCCPGSRSIRWYVWWFFASAYKRWNQARVRMNGNSFCHEPSWSKRARPLSRLLGSSALEILYTSHLPHTSIPWKGVGWSLQHHKQPHKPRNPCSWWVEEPRIHAAVVPPWATLLLHSLVEQWDLKRRSKI